MIKIVSNLNSINRTVKNVDKNLKDWLVRLYLDESVYKCIEANQTYLQTLDKSKSLSESEEIEIEKKERCITFFNNIINSQNVEVYTFYCKDKPEPEEGNYPVSLEEMRTFRYLVLIDPEVNISAIREADGYINNLECHNLKMFEKSDKLFYIPPIGSIPNLVNKQPQKVFHSYSNWLQLYKNIFERDYFSTHQNIYELLAGLFTIKLKLDPAFYYEKIQGLYSEILTFETNPTEIIDAYAPEDNSYPLPTMEIGIMVGSMIINGKTLRNALSKEQYISKIIELLKQGFDEILLLDIFKDIISFEFDLPTIENKWEITLNDTNNNNIENIKSLFLSYDSITSYTFDSNPLTSLDNIIGDLKKNNIISRDVNITIPSSPMMEEKRNAFIDGVILKNIIANHAFNINFNPINKTKSVLDALNLYYSQSYEEYYNDMSVAMKKYLKYKSKYLNLKSLALKYKF